MLRGIQVQKCKASLRKEVTDAISSVLFRVQMSGDNNNDNDNDNNTNDSSSSASRVKPTPLMGVLFSNHKLLASTITSEIDKANHPTPWDMLLLSNFVLSSPSFRENEGFSPICLPEFDDRRFVYCYICFIRPHLCLVLIDEVASSFEYLSLARRQFEIDIGSSTIDLLETMALEEAGDYIMTTNQFSLNSHTTNTSFSSASTTSSSSMDPKDTATIECGNKGWGIDNTPCPASASASTGLWHCCYHNRHLNQYTMPCLPKQFIARRERKLLMEAYTTLQIASSLGITPPTLSSSSSWPMHSDPYSNSSGKQSALSSSSKTASSSSSSSHRVVFLRNDRFALVACVSSDLHGMCVFDPCTERAEAVARYHQLSAWIRSHKYDNLFAPVGSF